MDTSIEERLVELPGKDALAAYLVEGLVEVLVTYGPDDLE